MSFHYGSDGVARTQVPHTDASEVPLCIRISQKVIQLKDKQTERNITRGEHHISKQNFALNEKQILVLHKKLLKLLDAIKVHQYVFTTARIRMLNHGPAFHIPQFKIFFIRRFTLVTALDAMKMDEVAISTQCIFHTCKFNKIKLENVTERKD